ncbi:MAG: hypothetical protein A2854_01085 [Parcubacteria group bacterium RIFCSPHIGHO2_01_FULL_56_18]|nr:MAG: hypothetical protein A2854_01085 [Parcubacteria group bacterium RIFCSPHIGHO2_01_FULL_56_18]
MIDYEQVEPTQAFGMLKTIRESEKLRTNRDVFIKASMNTVAFSEGEEGAEAYQHFLQSGGSELAIVVRDFYMLVTGLVHK